MAAQLGCPLVDSVKDPSSLLHNDEKEIFAYMCTSQDLTGVWKDRMDTYDFGDEHCYFFAPWIGPKPKNSSGTASCRSRPHRGTSA